MEYPTLVLHINDRNQFKSKTTLSLEHDIVLLTMVVGYSDAPL